MGLPEQFDWLSVKGDVNDENPTPWTQWLLENGLWLPWTVFVPGKGSKILHWPSAAAVSTQWEERGLPLPADVVDNRFAVEYTQVRAAPLPNTH